ncbi:MAG: hypothetical protein ACJ76J_20885 [Thermoanaerobaculia bacterium]
MPMTPPPPDQAGSPTVTREKQRLMAPPRTAVTEPGSGSAFGRSFFRRLRESQAGCFLLFFLAIGAGIFLFGVAGTVGPYKEGLRENGDPRFFYGAMAFGTVFFLVALRMMQVALAGVSYKAKKKGSRSEPWTWDHPWRKDWMPPDYTGGGSGTVLGRVAFLALIGMFNIAWLSGSWFFRAILLLFDLFALLIVYDSFQKLYQWFRFRKPVVIWETLPAFLGDELRGRIAFARGVRATAPPRLTLRCVRDEWVDTTSGDTASRQLQPQAVYRETREIPLPGAPGEALDFVDFVFEVPRGIPGGPGGPGVPGTDLAREEAVYWQVQVIVPLTGPDLETVFLAPVYQKR